MVIIVTLLDGTTVSNENYFEVILLPDTIVTGYVVLFA